MKKNIIILFSVIIALGSLNESCKCNSSSSSISKNDSIAIAKKIMEDYPSLQGPKVADFKSHNVVKTMAFNPIDFNKVELYAGNYDKVELIKGRKGFLIDSNGVKYIRENLSYKQLYLRFGKNTDDPKALYDYTIMILPLDDSSKLTYKGPSRTTRTVANNYDYLDPCPTCIASGELLKDN